jgi:hypothetical protein
MQDHTNNGHEEGPMHPLKSLTPAQFMALGGNAIVYVRPIKGAALSEIMDQIEVADDADFQLVVAADGSPLLVADSTESVAEWLADKDIGVVTLH